MKVDWKYRARIQFKLIKQAQRAINTARVYSDMSIQAIEDHNFGFAAHHINECHNVLSDFLDRVGKEGEL